MRALIPRKRLFRVLAVALLLGGGGRGLAEEAKPVPAPGTEDLPRFAGDSPFAEPYRSPPVRTGKRLWARSILYEKAPDLQVAQWLGDEPRTEGKFVLVELWATWCGPCRRSLPLLNRLHERFGDRLAVIGISDEDPAVVRAFAAEHIRFFCGLDPAARMKKTLQVQGIPHTLLLEPGGYVIWEGFPLQEGYELTEELVERALRAGADAEPPPPADGDPVP